MNTPRHREELLLNFRNCLNTDKEPGLEKRRCLFCRVEVFPQIKHTGLFLVLGIQQSLIPGGEESLLLSPAFPPPLPALIAINQTCLSALSDLFSPSLSFSLHLLPSLFSENISVLCQSEQTPVSPALRDVLPKTQCPQNPTESQDMLSKKGPTKIRDQLLQALSFSSGRNKNSSSLEQLPDWVPAVGSSTQSKEHGAVSPS